MSFDAPVQFDEALAFLRQKLTVPTDARTRELAQFEAALRERMAFSAGVTKAEFVDGAYGSVEQILTGTADRATMRLELKQMLQRMDYKPAKGKAGTLQDLSSDDRLNVILDTNVAMARGYGYWKQGQNEDLLDAFPAQEFLRVEARDNPRTDWPARWDAALSESGQSEGATASGSGRMVALKNHPIWVLLSRFGQPYEPFDFGSGMGTEDVSREDAMDLGIIDRDTRVEPEERPFNQDLQASPQIRSAALRQALEASGLGSFDAQGVFRWKGDER